MNGKVEIMGISLDICSVEEIMESINVHWNQEESLSTYGALTMKLFVEAQKDPELKAYIEMLDKAVPDDTEILWAAGLHDSEMEEEITQHGLLVLSSGFLPNIRIVSLFWEKTRGCGRNVPVPERKISGNCYYWKRTAC